MFQFLVGCGQLRSREVGGGSMPLAGCPGVGGGVEAALPRQRKDKLDKLLLAMVLCN